MGHESFSKPFLFAWLRRTRKQLSVSGRLSELALILSKEQQQLTEEAWRMKLHAIFQGDEEPSIELLTKIDSLLAQPSSRQAAEDQGAFLL